MKLFEKLNEYDVSAEFCEDNSVGLCPQGDYDCENPPAEFGFLDDTEAYTGVIDRNLGIVFIAEHGGEKAFYNVSECEWEETS